MNHINPYTRSHTSKLKAIKHTEIDHVVIFPSDNSFSVVKSKQCLPAEQDGFVLMQAGGKKYMGFIFETGTFEVCSKAADLLSQTQHKDIESDYERKKERSSSNDINSNAPEQRTFTTLKDVPFSTDTVTTSLDQSSSKPIVFNSNVTNVTTPIRMHKAADNSRKTKEWPQSRHESSPKDFTQTNTTNRIPASTTYTASTVISNISSSSITEKNSNSEPPPTTSNSLLNINSRVAVAKIKS